MKKLSAVGLSLVTYLSLAFPVHAVTIDLCPPSGQGFGVLCNVQLTGLVGTLVQAAFVIAIIIALAFLIYGGIKWITSGGDKAGVESARGTIVAALVGLVLVFLAYFILNIIVQFFTNANLGGLSLPGL